MDHAATTTAWAVAVLALLALCSYLARGRHGVPQALPLPAPARLPRRPVPPLQHLPPARARPPPAGVHLRPGGGGAHPPGQLPQLRQGGLQPRQHRGPPRRRHLRRRRRQVAAAARDRRPRVLHRAVREFSGAVFRDNAAKLAAVVSACAASEHAQPMEFQGLLQKAAMDAIFAVTFGSDLNTLGAGADEASRFAAAVDDASEFTLLRYVNPFWKAMRLLNVGPEAALRERVKVIDEFVYPRIRARSDELRRAAPPQTRQDMLSRFMEAASSSDTADGGGSSAGKTTTTTVDYKYLRDMVLNILIAGKDTTAEALAWFFYVACKHPRVQERVYQEAGEAVSVEEFAGRLTDEALGRMHYLHAALTETLRLYPSLPLNNKECFKDDVLPNGFSVSKGDIVFYVPYAMGRMEYLWGKDAEQFRPERWLDDNGEFQQESPFKFTAFQAGPRICLGKEFAYREMKVLAAVLLRFFVFRLRDEGASVSYRATITLLIEHGLHLTATPR